MEKHDVTSIEVLILGINLVDLTPTALPSMAEAQRIDLLVLGATGFTGRLVVRYLSTHPDFLDHKFTFALGGRSLNKLARIADEFNLAKDKVPHVDVDVLNPAQVTPAVLSARVVINAVGPYWRWGKLVVKCVLLAVT